MYPSHFPSQPGPPAPATQSIMTPPIASMNQMGAHPAMNPMNNHPALNTGIPPIGNNHGIHPAFSIPSMGAFAPPAFPSTLDNPLHTEQQIFNYNSQQMASSNRLASSSDGFHLIQSRIESHQIHVNHNSNELASFGRPMLDSVVQNSQQGQWSSSAATSQLWQWAASQEMMKDNRKRPHPDTVPPFGPQAKRVSPGPGNQPISQPNDALHEVDIFL